MTLPKQPLVPVYLVKGDDETFVGEAVRALLDQLVSGPTSASDGASGGGGGGAGADMVEDFGPDADIATVVDACVTPPFLAERRIVVVRSVGRLRADDTARLVEAIVSPLPTTVVVLVAGGGQTPPRLLAAVKKAGHVVDVAVPSAAKARSSWLAARLKDAPVRLDAPARVLMAEHLGEDLGRMSSILDAMAAAFGEGADVGVDELAPFLGEAGSVAPWDLTDAVDRGDVEQALVALHRMLAAGGDHPLVVMSRLHRHFQAMLRLDGSGVTDEQAAARLLGTAPFPARKAMSSARRLGPAGVARAIVLLADADLDLRGAQAWPDELVLEVLVARLCRLAPRSSGGGSRSGASRGGGGRSGGGRGRAGSGGG